ncbi:hypothetical protein [Brevibacillus massiliensis]|nr:hypothetical protein [Brevibacillus massiliensis]
MKDYKNQKNLKDKSEGQVCLEELKSSFSPYWEVKLYWGINQKFPHGTYVVEFTSKGRKRTSKSYLHHELMDENKFFSSVLADLASFGLYIDKPLLEKMIIFAIELRKQDIAEEVSTDKLNSLIGGGVLSQSDAVRNLDLLQEDLMFDFDDLAVLSENNYNPLMHKGIILDSIEYTGKCLIAVTRYTLMELFVWDEVEDKPKRGKYKSNARCMKLDEILQGWEDCGYLKKFTRETHKGQKIKGIQKEFKSERFYIIECPKVYDALINGVGGADDV